MVVLMKINANQLKGIGQYARFRSPFPKELLLGRWENIEPWYGLTTTDDKELVERLTEYFLLSFANPEL